jgi:hypothetical protein
VQPATHAGTSIGTSIPGLAGILRQTPVEDAGPVGRPPDPLPVAEWTGASWVGLLLYVFIFLLAAWWIYRLSGLSDSEPGEGQG